MEQRRVCFTLQTSEDEILEGEEFFPFSVESSDSAIAEIIPSSGQINIIDNDRKFSDVWECRTSKEWTHWSIVAQLSVEYVGAHKMVTIEDLQVSDNYWQTIIFFYPWDRLPPL